LIYLDTSAFVKKYFINEKGRRELIEILKANPQDLFASALTYLEALSALTRRKNEIAEYDKAVGALNDDWDAFTVWLIDEEILKLAAELVMRHRIRAADAIHLATAAIIRRQLKIDVLFVCCDTDLAQSAVNEGFSVIDPTVVEETE
jgi:hypothetical protein